VCISLGKVNYRGITLRLKLEGRFVVAIEKQMNLFWENRFLYEPKDLRVKYVDPNNSKNRTYWPDFYDVGRKIVYEIKHVGRAYTPLQDAKQAAFELEHPDKHYVLLTEREVSLLEKEADGVTRG